MPPAPISCLILACGNTLRGDDSFGPRLAEWAEEHFRHEPRVRVLSRPVWTPELAADLAHAGAVVFADSSAASSAGTVQILPVEPSPTSTGIPSHHLQAAQLLGLCRELYPTAPAQALLLTVGMDTTELGANFSEKLQRAFPEACAILKTTVHRLLGDAQRS